MGWASKNLSISLIPIFVLVVFMANPAFAHEQEPTRYLAITTHPTNHLAGESVRISGEYVNGTDYPISGMILLKAYDKDELDKAEPGEDVDEIKSALVFANEGSFQDKSFAFTKSGTYLVTAHSELETIGKTEIHVTDFYLIPAFYIAIAAVLAIAGLMYVMTQIGGPNLSLSVFRVSRFSLVSIFVLCMVLFFISSNVEYGTQSPVGIILKEPDKSDDETETIKSESDDPLRLDWVLHFGQYSVNPSDEEVGLSIPLFIMIFGVLGGYLRFFYFTSRPWLREEMLNRLDDTLEYFTIWLDEENYLKNEKGGKLHPVSDEKEKYDIVLKNAYYGHFHPTLSMILTNRVMSDLSLLLIAPVLAVMMFFVLSQSGLDPSQHVLSFAVSSFLAGLFTEDVIKKLKTMQNQDEEPKKSSKKSQNEELPEPPAD